eukprot:CAMPEP_0119352918 /NCGR_PEP_ID=MMETSP1334-20130426/2120_1 /TAXON_ID=127549 /ORGANISM="Calcidiscus leptoporus, Strain RCC1130" /LENGTH=316 /DNA_ID=CAMNT_0007366065 /DNA_START=94 /DNA_END=1044 /DNA_ORIENTATION=-
MASMTAMPTVTLNDQTAHPIVGYGTYKVGYVPASASAATTAPAESAVSAADCVKQALEVGYRFLDCAEFYGNEAEVGKAIAASGVPRSDLYLASKVWTTTIHNGPAAVQAQLEKTLRDLGVDYLDLYCIHWPVPGKHVAAYKQLEAAQKAGLVRSLGVSNYAIEDFKELMLSAAVTPAVNQIEINPFLFRKKTIEFFRSQGVALQSYRSLRDGKAFEEPTVVGVAAKHGRSAAQVLGRWCVQHGFIYIPKSVKAVRMRENMQVFDWALDVEDMAKLDELTLPAALDTYRALYIKCVVRDTPDAGRTELVRTDLTVD